MKTKTTTTRRGRLWQVLLLLALLAWTVPQQALADKLYSSSGYSMSTYSDHIFVKLLVADLVGRDSWLVGDSRLKAYSGYGRTGTSYNLVNVYSYDQDGNGDSTHGITACYDQEGAVAILTNAGNQQISWNRTGYTITKHGDYDYPQAEIDFYWGPQMAGKTWYIYFESTHDNGDHSTFYLGSVNCSDMRRTSLETSGYKYERTAARKIEFTTPKVPASNAGPASVQTEQVQEAWYNLTLDYTRYDGTTKQQTVKVDCGQAATNHDIEIPEDVGNFRRVDFKVEAVDALKSKSTGDYYYQKSTTYRHQNCMPTVPIPSALGTEYHQFDGKTDLHWTTYTDYGGSYNYYSDSKPTVYRIETDAKGEPLSGKQWSKRGTLSAINDTKSMGYSDKGDLEANKFYRYMVVNVPSAWTSSMSAQLATLDDDVLQQLGHCYSDAVSTAPTMSIHDLRQDTTVTEKVKLVWAYSRVPVSSTDVEFEVWRSKKDENNWTRIANPKFKANPEAGFLATCTDEKAESNVVRYDYKVTLSINSGINKFESNVTIGSLLAGTSIRSFEATKGTHQNSVNLHWQAHQVGTASTQFDVYRRYVNAGEDEWMKIYTTSGTGESYTYDDNTVQPGYYYQYRVEAYAGEKAQNTTKLSTLNAIGFCQARGVVSGRVTFATGNTSVADVRVTLRPAEEGTDNAVQSYAQRVEGASTGIAWKATEDELAKVFGPDKEFTVQMFVRPDSLLNAGAVIGEIPGEGRLVLGSMNNGEYDLAMQKASYVPVGSVVVDSVVVDSVAVDSVKIEPPAATPLPTSTKTTNLSTLTGDYTAQNLETLTGTLDGNKKISIANGAVVFLKDVTIPGNNSKSYHWAGINCPGDATLVLEGNNTVKAFHYQYPGIHIAEGKTLTIKGTGSLNASSYNSGSYGAGIGGGYLIPCGNIVIEGGTITATGGQTTAGIGGGYSTSCGNILIKGGTITANGGDYGAGIGSGRKGSCGSITITYVEKLTANRGYYACSIGKGYQSTTCGQVTMDGTVYPDGINVHAYTVSLKYRYSYEYIYKDIYEDIYGYVYGTATNTNVAIPSSKYSLLTVSRTGDNLQFQVDGGEAKTLPANKFNHLAPFSVGGSDGITEAQAFKGNLTEVRVWNHALTEKEKASYNDRVLSGRESGLALYWPMDEGIDRLVFDASYANDLPNGRHATVGPNITSSQIVPATNQLSRYGVTNENGEYTIRGIPFVGSGSSYSFVPTKGIHEFSPVSRNGFIGPGSMALNNLDFSDQSSFPLRGKVTYLDTDIPVDSVSFKIDGTEAQNKDGIIYTDANGQYEISVPIGRHRIEAYRKGHRLTSMPMGASDTYNFMQAEVCNFVDSTLVNVTGRINGGFTDQDAPLGFRLSKNRIGQATVKLSLGRSAQSSFNYVTDEHGSGSFGTTKIDVLSATDSIKSTAWRGAGKASTTVAGSVDDTDTHYIYIKTDAETGEFSALLPPLKYQVESITFDGDEPGDKARYNNLAFFKQNLPIIDATRADDKELKQDSLVNDGQATKYYKYSAKFMRQLRVTPDIKVEQTGMKNGAFGVDSVEVVLEGGEKLKLEAVKYNGDKYTYNYGYPLFIQGEDYEMTISTAEHYYNVDTKETAVEIPGDATIHVTNEGSASATVVLRDTIAGGDNLGPSHIWKKPEMAATLSEHGHVKYTWTAGYPNLTGEFLRDLDISVKVGNDGSAIAWEAPNHKANDTAMPLIVLGSIVTGTNFVSGGPDYVDIVLRRPPGSTSYAQLATDTIHSDLKTTIQHSYSKTAGGPYVSVLPKFKSQLGIPGATTEHEVAPTLDEKVLAGVLNDTSSDSIKGNTYTISQAMKTPATSTYTQNNGDTYIGRATNTLFGKGFALGLFKNSDGIYVVDKKESICTGKSFGTTFIYPQQYIEDVLIPNWILLRNNLLTYVDDPMDDSKAKKVPGKVMYYTKWKPGDPQYGSSNNDLTVWTQAEIDASGCRSSYRMVDGLDENDLNITDSVAWCNKQITMWKELIAANEQDKLNAFNDDSRKIGNFSIAGGTMVSESHKNSRTDNYHYTNKHEDVLSSETHAGLLINSMGMYAIVTHESQSGKTTTTTNDWTYGRSVSWQMSDAEPTTALSVDVFESGRNWSPIFRTRGGQTSNPYEGATYTKYYQPGTKLDEATMRVEKPELRIDGASTATNVPTGGQAIFNLELINASETNNACTYTLMVKENSNSQGAVLMMDGNILSNGKDGRSIPMKGGELIKKQLVVQQSARNIIDYEDITLVLRSQKDSATVSNPVKLSVYFKPTSAMVDMTVDHTVLNKELWQKNNGVIVTMENLDRRDEGLAGMRVRYRKKGTDAWHEAKLWKVKPGSGETELPNTPVISTAVSFLEDGIYELQAQTFGMFGNQEVTYETDIVEVTQDTRGPKLLGMVSPEDGLLTWLNRNNMHLRMNETLNSNALSQSANFILEGGMNNMVTDKGRPYPDVALQLNRDSVETEAMYDLTGSSFALDLWLYRQGDGKIVSIGTSDNQLSLSTHDGGLVSVCIGNEENTVDGQKKLPENEWTYLAMNYKQGDTTNSKGELTLLYATADKPDAQYVFKNEEVEAVDVHGKLAVGGNGMQGMMARMSMWKSDKTADMLYDERNLLRAPYTPGLVGYWKMDEGHGTQLTDIARSRHMKMPTESWYINNRNLAAHLDGEEGSALKIDVTTLKASSLDNFAYEMWFRGTEAANADATLMSVDNAANGKTTIGFEGGKLALKVSDSSTTLSNQNYLDNNWHHVALNVRRGTSAIAYVDGEAVKVLPESNVPGIKSRFITVGAELTGNQEQKRFTGDVDEIRIWNAALDGQLIKERMYERMDNSYPGLEGYFPMENVNRNQQSTVTTFFTLKNYGDADSQQKIIYGQLDEHGIGIEVEHADTADAFRQAIYQKVQATNAPGLRVGSSKMRMDDSQYAFTASGDEIYLSFPDGSLPLMDGNDFVATVSNIKDEHDNNSEPVSWKFHCDFAALAWNIDEETLSKPWNEPMEWQVYIANRTGMAQSYELSGLPTWMTVDKQIGTIGSDGGSVTFRMSTGVPVGRHTEYIYLTDQLGIRRVLRLNLTVTGNVPDWTVDPDLYESNMTVTGQIYIDGKICENTDTKIAAFDELNLCRGVASPRYVRTRDAYYVDMVIYGASATELSTGKRNLEFKVYDASKGTICPIVATIKPDNTEPTDFQYVPDANYGSYDAPVVFDVLKALEQQISLAKGWTWTSLYVDPLIPNLEFVLPKNVDIRKRFKNIKSKTAFATVDKNGDINGLLETLEPGQMYKMQLTTKTDYPLVGMVIDVKNTPQTMYYGYNWIGTLSSSVMSVDEAFADLQPETGDRVKSRTAFAEFSNKGYWEGTLESIVPGQGYIYRSLATEAKTFHYPDKTATQQATRRAEESSQPTHFTPVDPYLYPDNLSIIAVVKKDGQERDDAELGAFIDDECRGAIAFRKGYYFLTVMGSSQDDSQKKMELRVYADGEEYMVDDTLPFISDAFYGSLDEPYVLDLDATAIREISSSADDDDDDWWSIQGFKIGRKPTKSGVYIHHGRKVTIKRVK